MPIQFQNVTYIYFDMTEAITHGASVSINEAESAVANRRVMEFLDHYDEIDLSRFTEQERGKLNEAFLQYGPAEAQGVHVTDNGLRYIAASCVVILDQGVWRIPGTNFEIDTANLELQL